MPGFYRTPELKAKRGKMRLELAFLNGKKKLLGALFEKGERRRWEILLNLSKHY